MKVLTGDTLRQLAKKANMAQVSQDKVVTIMKEGNQYLLIYYGVEAGEPTDKAR